MSDKKSLLPLEAEQIEKLANDIKDSHILSSNAEVEVKYLFKLGYRLMPKKPELTASESAKEISDLKAEVVRLKDTWDSRSIEIAGNALKLAEEKVATDILEINSHYWNDPNGFQVKVSELLKAKYGVE